MDGKEIFETATIIIHWIVMALIYGTIVFWGAAIFIFLDQIRVHIKVIRQELEKRYCPRCGKRYERQDGAPCANCIIDDIHNKTNATQH